MFEAVMLILLLMFLMMLGAAALVTSGLRRRVNSLEEETRRLTTAFGRLGSDPLRGAQPEAPSDTPDEVPDVIDQGATPRRTIDAEVDEARPCVTASLGASLRAWFAGGNTIVRVAMLILLIGVGFLVRYAAEQGWFPLEARLACAALGGAACAFVGWWLRTSRRGYGLTLQGGGLAIVFVVVFAALRLYGLIHAAPAFVLLALLAATTAVLAQAQNALPVAVLGLAGAFLAPVLASTNQGNHVVLFGWYAVVNLAVAWLATRRPWKLLNTLGFACTTVVALGWGASRWTPSLLPSTEPFLLLHLALYLFVTVQYARRIVADEVSRRMGTGMGTGLGDVDGAHADDAWQSRPVAAMVDAGLLFGAPLAAFGMQVVMLRHLEYGTAFTAAAFAAVYLGLARRLWQRLGVQLRLLTEGMLALGVVFLSLVAPYALEGPWIAMAWGMQAAGMVWMALRQKRPAALLLGMLLLVLAVVALWAKAIPRLDLVGAMVVGVAAFVCAWMLARWGQGFAASLMGARVVDRVVDRVAARSQVLLDGGVLAGLHALALALALICLLAGGWVEIAHTAGLSDLQRQQAMLLWVAILAAGFEGLRPRLSWPALRGVARVMALVAMLAWVARMALAMLDGPALAVWRVYMHHGGVATTVALAATVLWLMRRAEGAVDAERSDDLERAHDGRAEHRIWPIEVVAWGVHALVHAAAFAWSLVASFVAPRGSWSTAIVLAAPLVVMVGMLAAQRRERWPFTVHPTTWHRLLAWPLLMLGAVWALFVDATSSAAMQPLPYLPLVNPIDLMHVALALVAWRLARDPARPPHLEGAGLAAVFAGVGFVWVSSMLVRTLHHAAGSPLWLDGALGSSTVHTGLSVLWTTLALASMALATKRGLRTVWMVGAALLAVVVAKLLLVDMSQSSAALRIVSFVGVGVLMLVIGYLASLPPPQAGSPTSGTPPTPNQEHVA